MKKLLLMLVFSSLLFVSCDEDHDDDHDHDHDEHFEAATWQIIDEDGNIFMEITNPEINPSYNVNFTMTVDQEAEFSIVFLDEDGDVSEPDHDEYSLAVVIGDETIVDLHEHDGDHFEFELHALMAGETDIELQVEHDGHTDAKTVKIPVIVE